MKNPEEKVYRVLMADDSAEDRFFVKNALDQTAALRVAGEVSNGADAIAYLRGHAEFSNRTKFPLPDLLLLDLKMPLKDGFQVLEWIKSEQIENITVVVLTESMQPEHIKRALDLGADLFQIKPRTKNDRQTMAFALEDYLHRNSIAPRHGYKPMQAAV